MSAKLEPWQRKWRKDVLGQEDEEWARDAARTILSPLDGLLSLLDALLIPGDSGSSKIPSLAGADELVRHVGSLWGMCSYVLDEMDWRAEAGMLHEGPAALLSAAMYYVSQGTPEWETAWQDQQGSAAAAPPNLGRISVVTDEQRSFLLGAQRILHLVESAAPSSKKKSKGKRSRGRPRKYVQEEDEKLIRDLKASDLTLPEFARLRGLNVDQVERARKRVSYHQQKAGKAKE